MEEPSPKYLLLSYSAKTDLVELFKKEVGGHSVNGIARSFYNIESRPYNTHTDELKMLVPYTKDLIKYWQFLVDEKFMNDPDYRCNFMNDSIEQIENDIARSKKGEPV